MTKLKRKRTINNTFSILAAITIAVGSMILPANAATADISGVHYELGEKDMYVLSGATQDGSAPYGKIAVAGDISEEGTKNGVPSLTVSKGNLSLSYVYTDELLNATGEDWHLIDDGGKKIDAVSLDKKIEKGAIVVQTSKDKNAWVDLYTETNIFETNPNSLKDFLSTTDVQLTNGCYYRVLVAYKLERGIDPNKFLFISVPQTEQKECVEVFTFYASRGEENVAYDPKARTYELGDKVRTEKMEGYVGEKAITSKDPHYGWDIGKFVVSGFTGYNADNKNNVIFLKNVGDQVALSFHLNYDINHLNDDDTLSVLEDSMGTDQYFETPKTDFGHGALIVRQINSGNEKSKPQVYTNYLEATATPGANTKIDLFEEGDYEVALDYGVKHDKTKIKMFGDSVLPEEGHYRIFFTFSVRNSNAMFYPRDSKTGSELSDKSFTPNGFTLDLANSKYLELIVVKKVLKPDGNALQEEDVRFNRIAKDGDSFTDQGVYTITVKNQYTGQSTEKSIYVGNDDVLKAYVKTGLSVSEIKDKIADGATIAADGSIVEPVIEEVEEVDETAIEDEMESKTEETPDTANVVEQSLKSAEEMKAGEEESVPNTSDAIDKENAQEEPQTTKSNVPVMGGLVLAVAISVSIIFTSKRKRGGDSK